MTTSPHKPARTQNRYSAFTLVEVIIAASLGSMILAGVVTAFVMLVQSSVRVSNYSRMESETRRAFEHLAINARMANRFSAVFSGGVITSVTFTIPNNDLSAVTRVTYGFDTSNSTNRTLFVVPGGDPNATAGRFTLVNRVTGLSFLRYDRLGVLIPASTTTNTGVKHLQVSLNVTRSGSGAATTQVIRSSAFTLRNIST